MKFKVTVGVRVRVKIDGLALFCLILVFGLPGFCLGLGLVLSCLVSSRLVLNSLIVNGLVFNGIVLP